MNAGRLNRALWFTLGLLLAFGASALGDTRQTHVEKAGEFQFETTLSDLVKPDQIAGFADQYQADDVLSWSVYVPKSYDPENPPGLFVFISPIRDGSIRPSWRQAFDNHNLIYISANQAGNFVTAKRRYYNSVLAINFARQKYNLNEDIKIVSGFSGGGRMASRILEFVPGGFTGGLMIGGAFDWLGSEEEMPEVLEGGAYVFLTGDRDSAEWETKRLYLQYKRVGISNIKYISVRAGRTSFRVTAK